MSGVSHEHGTGLLAGTCLILIASLVLAAFGVNAAEEPEPARPAAPGWLGEAKAKLPAALIAGRIISFDEDALKAAVAVFPAGGESPAHPGSAFDPGQVLEVSLARKGDGLAITATALRPRRAEEAPKDDDVDTFADLMHRLATEAKRDPGVIPCQIRGWSADTSAKGLAVHAAPSRSAPILGRLGAPLHTAESAQGSEAGWRAEFDITGYRDGWFRIANATPPGTGYEDPLPKRRPRTYAGRGWVRVEQVSGAYANSQMPVQRLLLYPNVDAPDIAPGADAGDPLGNLSIDGSLEKLHACSANWALTTSRDGRRGWWRGICSNQVTNCS